MSKITGGFWAWLGGLTLVALAAVLVKPGAQTANVLQNAGHAGGQLISAAEGNPITG